MTPPGRPCRNPRCFALQPCALHPTGPFANARRSSNLYDTPQWRARRRAQLQAEPYCRDCGAVAVVADHITPHRGDPTAFFHGALQSLCKTCSNRKTGRETRERARA